MKLLRTLFLLLFFCGIFPVTTIIADDISQNGPTLDLIHTLGCKGCHVINNDGGSLAPDLTQAGSRLTAKQIEAQLTAHISTRTKRFMPDYSSLAKKDLQLISNYLYNLR